MLLIIVSKVVCKWMSCIWFSCEFQSSTKFWLSILNCSSLVELTVASASEKASQRNIRKESEMLVTEQINQINLQWENTKKKFNHYFKWVFLGCVHTYFNLNRVKNNNKCVKFGLHSILSHNWVISWHRFSRGKFRPSRSIYAWHKFPNYKTAAAAAASVTTHLHRMMPLLHFDTRCSFPWKCQFHSLSQVHTLMFLHQRSICKHVDISMQYGRIMYKQ